MTIPAEKQSSFKKLADRLGRSWLDVSIVDGLTPMEVPRDRSEAYFIQDRMAEAIGQPVTGWKVGATSAKAREKAGIDDLIPGRTFASTTYFGADHKLPGDRFPSVAVEAEFAFCLREDIPLRDSPWVASELSEKVEFFPSIEIIGLRHQLPNELSERKLFMSIADNGGGVGVVYGDVFEGWKEIDLRNHHVHLQVDDNPPQENLFGEMRCEPLEALADTLNHLAGRGLGLKAGQFVTTGTTTAPPPLPVGARLLADFGDMGSISVYLG